ncbi:MAG: hypothetical protein J0L92_07585 [Deltaproteobacteria bacterium]|nr:hypothetical protein [Deltaproteobacteria bacterium]
MTRTLFDPITQLVRVALAVSVAGLGACGGATPRSGADDPTRLEPRRLFPMGANYSWAHDNDPGGGLPRQTSVLRVTAYDGRSARLESLANGNSRTYELREDGIFWVESSVYLLRSPIAVGAEWPSINGRTARVSDIDVSVDVPTGHFDHCVEIREDGGESGLTTRTIYCPDVGPTLIEAHQSLTLGTGGVTGTGRLQAYQLGDDDE